MSQQYHIALCSDNNYLPYCFVTCQSIINSLDLAYNNSDTIIFHIIIDKSVNSANLKNKTNQFLSRNNCPIEIIFQIHIIDSSIFDGAPKLRGSYGTYYRILIDRILSDDISTILYLDLDILVRKDIRYLFNSVDINNSLLAACLDYELNSSKITPKDLIIKSISPFKKDLYINNNKYFNAGVLLINLDLWRKCCISEKCFDLLRTHSPIRHDQDLLNYLVKSKEILDIGWNFHIYNFFLGFDKVSHDYSDEPSLQKNITEQLTCKDWLPNAEQFESTAKDPSIIHFTYIKPWGVINCAYSELPRVKAANIFKFIKEWHNTAKKVTEFSEELSSLEYCQFANYDFIDCLINHKVSVNQQNIDKLMKGRKKDKKGLVSAIIVLLIMQIITFVILFLK